MEHPQLALSLPLLGHLRPAPDPRRNSCWLLGCETLDRDFADFQQYKAYLPALGIPLLRLQAGWAKTEKTPGTYDFQWLDTIVDDAGKLGLQCLLETDYGNPVYPGGGDPSLAGGFPTSTEALEAWDRWVRALALHFRGRVQEWAMWNEPDIVRGRTPEEIVEFNIRTARILRDALPPEAKISGLSLAHSGEQFFQECLWALKDRKGDDLFDSYTYHGYKYNPDAAADAGLRLKKILADNQVRGTLRQGENGCPSEKTVKFALKDHPWTEFTQAKWDLRRFLRDYCDGVQSCVFTICDFNHIGREINRKGLLMADEQHRVLRPKMAYDAIRHLTTVFNDQWERQIGRGAIRKDTEACLYTFAHRESRMPLLAFWDRSQTPTDQTRPEEADILLRNTPLPPRPVLLDLLSGRVFAFPREKAHPLGECLLLEKVPCTDSPLLLGDASSFPLAP